MGEPSIVPERLWGLVRFNRIAAVAFAVDARVFWGALSARPMFAILSAAPRWWPSGERGWWTAWGSACRWGRPTLLARRCGNVASWTPWSRLTASKGTAATTEAPYAWSPVPTITTNCCRSRPMSKKITGERVRSRRPIGKGVAMQTKVALSFWTCAHWFWYLVAYSSPPPYCGCFWRYDSRPIICVMKLIKVRRENNLIWNVWSTVTTI